MNIIDAIANLKPESKTQKVKSEAKAQFERIASAISELTMSLPPNLMTEGEIEKSEGYDTIVAWPFYIGSDRHFLYVKYSMVTHSSPCGVVQSVELTEWKIEREKI